MTVGSSALAPLPEDRLLWTTAGARGDVHKVPEIFVLPSPHGSALNPPSPPVLPQEQLRLLT